MKKEYNTPVVELVEFDYKEQIVTSGGVPCTSRYYESGWNSPGLATCNVGYTDK